jgi:serine/threonine-protein kinase
MRAILTSLCLVLLLTARVWAGDLVLTTVPRGASVYENDRLLGATVGSSPLTGTARLALTEGRHTLALKRPPYNDVVLDVGWHEGQWMAVRGDQFVPLERVSFSRDVRLVVQPPALAAWFVVPGVGGKQIENQTVVQLEKLDNDTFRVVDAFESHKLYLEAPWHEYLPLSLAEGELEGQPGLTLVYTASWRHPPLLTPARLLAALAVLAGVMVMVARRRRPAVAMVAPSYAQPATSEDGGGSTGLTALVGRTICSDDGTPYRITRNIGSGGMGVVFEARNAQDEAWAVKFLHATDSEDTRRRFAREARICAGLHHPNIVKTLDAGEYQPSPSNPTRWPFMVMELVRGGELREHMQRAPGSQLPLAQALAWMLEALMALRVAHAAGIIHRDLKPENIMITDRGHVKIMDFGMARQQQVSGLTASDTAIGTPLYMAPENLNAKTVSAASDIYSLGIVLFEMLSGRVPFEGDDVMAVLMSKLSGGALRLADLRPDLPADLVAVVERMFAQEVAARYATADEVIDALTPFVAATETSGGRR